MDREKLYEDLREMYDIELQKVTKGELTDKALEVSYKVLDCIKDLNEICEKDRMLAGAYDEMSSAKGYSRKQSMGMPFSMGGSYEGRPSFNGGASRGYGSFASRNSAFDHIQALMDGAKTEQERMMYQRWLEEARQQIM